MAALLAKPHAVCSRCRHESSSSTTTSASAPSRALLEARGHAVVGEAADGEQALAAARRLHPDTALVDVQLPDTTGFALARRLIDGNRGVRIVLTSTDPTLGAVAAIADSGAVAFVPKDQLAISDLATWLDRRSSG
jgi:DNA-binding NarL/FixJ family response regulator